MFTKELYQQRDESFWAAIEKLAFPRKDIIRHFPSFIRRRELAKFLVHYELFKQIIELPGNVVELGVYKGASLFTWSKLLETFCPGDRGRKVYGFDSFQGLTDFSAEDGENRGPGPEKSGKVHGGYQTEAEPIRQLVELNNQDNILAGANRCILVEGNILETLPRFLDVNPGFRVCLLHLDVDLYTPTLRALELVWPRLVKGGIVLLDEYGVTEWQGESQAVEDFFRTAEGGPRIVRKSPLTDQPGGYIVK